MRVVDLRSDFLSRPSAAMLQAMEQAGKQASHFGLREDTRQIELEKRVAQILDTEDALLVPTCTMANEIALMLLAKPGEIVATQAEAHIITSEAAAPAALGGLLVTQVPGDRVMPPVEAWEAMARQCGDELKPRVSVFALENTHNRSGGGMMTPEYFSQVCAVAKAHGVRVHLDGSRLFNAAIAQSCKPHELTRGCDTVAISLNKGLGAPLGAVLAGSHDLISRALLLRQRLGGGIRPTGMISAAGLLALEDWSHLADDHRRAKMLAETLQNVSGIVVDAEAVRSNIVLAAFDDGSLPPDAFCTRLAARGVLALPVGASSIRLVTYQGIDDEAVEFAAAGIAACL
jgi:threonine aldolase